MQFIEVMLFARHDSALKSSGETEVEVYGQVAGSESNYDIDQINLVHGISAN